LNSVKIGKTWKKPKLNSEKIWKIWKKPKLNDKIWKIQNANDDSVTVYIARTQMYWKSPLFWLVHFLQSDWLIDRK
jgi:hypothetical protein